MKLKASVDYGVRAVMYLAAKGETCSSREISEAMAVPRDYLIQLALRLRDAGILKAWPGKKGGYELASDPAEITVGQILEAFDGDQRQPRQQMNVDGHASDEVASAYAMHELIMASLNSYLDSITVQSLIDAVEAGMPAEQVIASSLRREADRLAG